MSETKQTDAEWLRKFAELFYQPDAGRLCGIADRLESLESWFDNIKSHLRVEFAAAALTGLLANPNYGPIAQTNVGTAIEHADAMLAALEEKP